MKQCHVFVSGFVQGVGYRKFVRDNARKLGLVGWVRNIADGRVEAVISGEKELIDKLILLCKKGPFLSDVESVDVEWEKTKEEFSEFLIKHDYISDK